jgi:hypothetical protein
MMSSGPALPRRFRAGAVATTARRIPDRRVFTGILLALLSDRPGNC